jgi:hypothetical protein
MDSRADGPRDTDADPDAGLDRVDDGMTSIDIPAGAAYNEAVPEPGSYETPTPDAVSAVVSETVPVAVPVARVLPVIDVDDLSSSVIRDRVDPAGVRGRMRSTVERLEALLDQEQGPGLLFDRDREDPNDRVIRARELEPNAVVWIIGDLHGDLLALEAALEFVQRDAPAYKAPHLVFLGDFFDDGGYGLEVLLRVFELMVEAPANVCVVVGNHDEALRYTGSQFATTVTPSDFTDFLNAHLAHEWITRAGKVAVRLFATAPRAVFLPDGLLITHGGFPLRDLHADLRASRDWNDPRCLDDFTWTRAHPRARTKMPNRTTRGSQFGYEDFDAFCELSAELGRPVTHMVRGHDHVDERYEIYPAYAAHPVLTTVALSRRLDREAFGSFERVPTIARWVSAALPQVYRLHVPAGLIHEIYPEGNDAMPQDAGDTAGGDSAGETIA